MNKAEIEHLKNWEESIKICFDYIRFSTIKNIMYLIWINRWVDWYSSIFRNKLMWNIMPEKDSYVISDVNSKNKISRKYYDCTWLVIVWKNEKWKNISLLTHQDPKYLFKRKDSYDCQIKFKNDLLKRIEKFKKLAIEWTVDIFILWWNYHIWEVEHCWIKFDMKDNYLKSIEFLSNIVKNHFWFYPEVTWPNFDCWYTDIFFDTKNRRLFQRRTLIEDFTRIDNITFKANEIDEQIDILDFYSKQREYLYGNFWD